MHRKKICFPDVSIRFCSHVLVMIASLIVSFYCGLLTGNHWKFVAFDLNKCQNSEQVSSIRGFLQVPVEFRASELVLGHNEVDNKATNQQRLLNNKISVSNMTSHSFAQTEGGNNDTLQEEDFLNINATQYRSLIKSYFPRSSKLIQIYRTTTGSKFIAPVHRSCAVVGNSGILLNSSYGELIDQHNLVIRANLPGVKGYESDVGRKSNITSLNTPALKKLVKQLNVTSTKSGGKGGQGTYIKRLIHLNNTILWYPLDLTEDARGWLDFVADKLEKRGLSVHLAFSPFNLRDPTRRIWNIPEHLPSAGLLLYTIATTLCEEVSLFGFYPFYTDCHNREIKYHYYDDTDSHHDLQNRSRHKMPEENRIFQNLHQLGFLHLMTPNCSLETSELI